MRFEHPETEFYYDRNFCPTPIPLTWEELRRRYTAGYAAEVGDLNSSDAIATAAAVDLEEIAEAFESAGRDRGWDECAKDHEFELEEALRDQKAQTEKALQRLQEHTGKPLEELAYFIKSIRIETPPSIDDTEAWAHQDGFNESLDKILQRLEAIKAGLR